MKPPLILLLTGLLHGCWITGLAAEVVVGATNVQTSLIEPNPILLTPLQTKGNRIVSGTAEIVRFKGLMIPDPGRLGAEGRYTRALFETVRETGANVIRIPVHPQFWARDPDYVRRYLSGDAGAYGDPLMAYLAARGIGWVACWFDEKWQPAMLLPDGRGYTIWGRFATLELKGAK
jgi:hypothetical protein